MLELYEIVLFRMAMGELCLGYGSWYTWVTPYQQGMTVRLCFN